MVNKEVQIKVLLGGDAFGFACKTLGVSNMMHHSYADVFTVSKEEVFAYVAIHGIPQSDATGKYFKTEGFHYYKEQGKWHTYFRERGRILTKRSLIMMKLVRNISSIHYYS